MGVRLPITDYVYGDPEHPERVTRTVSGPAYTREDHALLAAMKLHRAHLCPGCSAPKEEAWHSDMEGWYDAHGFVCHSCSARSGHEVAYTAVATSRDFDQKPLTPFVLGETTTKPTPPKKST